MSALALMEPYIDALGPNQRRVFLALDHYSDGAVGLFVMSAAAVLWLVDVPGNILLTTVALMFPAALLAYSVNRACKRFLRKQRPNRLYEEMMKPWECGSFPSFHSQFGAALTTTLCTSIALLTPAPMKLQACGLALLTMGIPLVLTAWSRLYLGAHDRADIWGGLLIGACLGVVVPFAAIGLGWAPMGFAAWGQVAMLACFVFALSSRERRRRRAYSRSGLGAKYRYRGVQSGHGGEVQVKNAS